MPLSTATITYNLADLVGVPRFQGTSVTATTNIPGDTVVDTDGNKIRLGSGKGTINADGSGQIVVWVPGAGSNPSSWQTYIHVKYREPRVQGGGNRTFGPFTITANADLADLIQEQEIPPNYAAGILGTMAAAQSSAAASATSAAASAAIAAEIAGADTADVLITYLDSQPDSDFRIQQDARVAQAARTPFPSGLTGARYYDIAQGVYGARGYLPTAKKEIDRTRIAGNGLKRIACVGHSIVAGAGPVVPGSTAWPDRLRAILNQHGMIKAGTGVVIAQNGTTARDSRYTFSAGWSTFAVNSPALVATSVGQTVTFATGTDGTQIDVYTYDTTNTMSVTIDGVAKTAIAGAFTDAVRKFSFTGLANTTHTLVLTTTTADQSFIVGVECHSGDGLSVSNLGIAGADTNQWQSSVYYHHAGILRYIDPILTFIECQVNDAKSGYTAAQWKTWMGTVIDYAKESGEAVLVIDPTPNPTAVSPYPAISPTTWLAYRQAALDVADAKGCPVIDLSEIFGTWQLGKAAGWMFDSVHPTEIGSEVIARAAADLLL